MPGRSSATAALLGLLAALWVQLGGCTTFADLPVQLSTVSLTSDIVVNPTECTDEPVTKETAQELFDSGAAHVVLFYDIVDELGKLDIYLWSNVTLATFNFGLQGPYDNAVEVQSIADGLAFNTPNFVAFANIMVDELPNLDMMIVGYSLEGSELQGIPAQANGSLLLTATLAPWFIGDSLCPEKAVTTMPSDEPLNNDVPVSNILVCPQPIPPCAMPAVPMPCDEPASTLNDAEALFGNPFDVVLFVPLPDADGNMPLIIYSSVTLATFVFNLVTPEGMLLTQVMVSGGIAESTPDFVVEPMVPIFEPFILGFSLEGAELQGIEPVNGAVLTVVNVGPGFAGVNVCPDFWQFSAVQEGYLDNDVLVPSQVICEGPIDPCAPTPAPAPMPVLSPPMSPMPPLAPTPCGEPPSNSLEDAKMLLGDPFQVVLFFPLVNSDGQIEVTIFSNEDLVTFAFNLIGPDGDMIMANSVFGGVAGSTPNFVISIDLPVLVDYVLGFSLEPEDPAAMIPASEDGALLLIIDVGQEFAGQNVCSSMWQFAQVMGMLGSDLEEVLDGIIVCEGSGEPAPPCPPPPPSSPPMASVISDPHFVGFRGQRYDVMGVAGSIYNLIADEIHDGHTPGEREGDDQGQSIQHAFHKLHLNARFATAYTTGMYMDDATMTMRKFRPQGTWMREIGVVLTTAEDQHVVTASTRPHDFADLCELKPDECFRWGTLAINGIDQAFVGSLTMGAALNITWRNSKSFGRATIATPHHEVEIDFVPPPEQWGVSQLEAGAYPTADDEGDTEDDKGIMTKYSHLNLKLVRVSISERANGIIGCSIRSKTDTDGTEIMRAFDKNGSGILEAPLSAYKVASIEDDQFPSYTEDWDQMRA